MTFKKALTALLIILLFWLAWRTYGPVPKQKTISVAGKHLQAEIANTPAQRERGLSDREDLCPDCGLLFIFDQAGVYSFWMRRMLFDIDILWIAEDKVVDITFGAKKPNPEDFAAPKEIYQSKVPADKVLEVNSGWVEKNGIRIGDVVK